MSKAANIIKLAMRRTDEAFDRDMGEAMETAMEAPEPAPVIPLTILEKSHNATSRALDHLIGDKTRLESEIAERTERLRQTNVAIEAYSKADEIIEAGKLQAAE